MLQEFCAVNTLSPAIAGALPHGEPLDACIFMGMGFARRPRYKQHCNTKAKLDSINWFFIAHFSVILNGEFASTKLRQRTGFLCRFVL